MRSAVGAFCPRSRRLDLLDDFRPCDALPALEEVVFFGLALCACAGFANTPGPAASSSVRARCIAFRVRIINRVWLNSVDPAAITAERRPVLCRTSKASRHGRCPAGEEP